VAHEAARKGHLPSDFDRWELTDKDGWTVAHVAARRGHLPPDYDRWEWADWTGWTVAHVAAAHDHLPPGFDCWELTDEDGRTVAHVAARYGHLPPGLRPPWEFAAPHAWTASYVATGYAYLSHKFNHRKLIDKDGGLGICCSPIWSFTSRLQPIGVG